MVHGASFVQRQEVALSPPEGNRAFAFLFEFAQDARGEGALMRVNFPVAASKRTPGAM
jgi:hypothetical protein